MVRSILILAIMTLVGCANQHAIQQERLRAAKHLVEALEAEGVVK